MARILITGVAGFTGHHVAARLRADGHDIHGTVKDHDGRTAIADIRLHPCDIVDPAAISAVVAQIRPDHVLHLAAVAFAADRNFGAMAQSNIVGTRNLLEALAQHPHGPQSIVVASSAHVYDARTTMPLREDAPLAPPNEYGITKLATEHLCRLYADRLPITIARPFNYTGVGQSADFIIPKIVDHVRTRKPELRLGTLDVARDFSDVRIVADIYARLLFTPAAVHQTVNICAGRAIALRDIVDMAMEISSHSMQISVTDAFSRPNDASVMVGSTDRLTRLIGAVDMPPFAETLQWMIAHH